MAPCHTIADFRFELSLPGLPLPRYHILRKENLGYRGERSNGAPIEERLHGFCYLNVLGAWRLRKCFHIQGGIMERWINGVMC